MKIYVVLAGWDYEGYDIQFLGSTQEKADIVLTKIKEIGRFDNVKIEEWDVDETI